MERLVSIGEAAKALGVSITTLRRWEASGRLAAEYTAGGHRRYDLAKLKPELFRAAADTQRRTVAYARVSSHDQKDDLERQKQVLELNCARQGWTFEVIADLGSGMNYHKKGLKKLLEAIIDGQIGRLVITHKDRLLRFGAELVFAICEAKGVEVVVYEPTLTADDYFNSRVIRDFDMFKSMCDVVVANRFDESLRDIAEKVYTRDLFFRD